MRINIRNLIKISFLYKIFTYNSEGITKQDIRKGIKRSFLYKRFAYNSDGFIELVKFLEDENLLDDFLKEFSFSKSTIERDLNILDKLITINDFFDMSSYSFSFMKSKLGRDFWYSKTFGNKNFQKICDKVL